MLRIIHKKHHVDGKSLAYIHRRSHLLLSLLHYQSQPAGEVPALAIVLRRRLLRTRNVLGSSVLSSRIPLTRDVSNGTAVRTPVVVQGRGTMQDLRHVCHPRPLSASPRQVSAPRPFRNSNKLLLKLPRMISLPFVVTIFPFRQSMHSSFL
jgi:hypothetical protein